MIEAKLDAEKNLARAVSRRNILATGVSAGVASIVGAPLISRTQDRTAASLPDLPQNYRELTALSGPGGRVVVSDSLSYLSLRKDLTVAGEDVVVGCSFAGLVTFAPMLALGPRAVIAHAAGVGLDQAGVAGLALAQRLGVPGAACETMSARLSDGRSLYEEGVIGHVNETAKRFGVEPGMPVRVAAARLLSAPLGAKRPALEGADSYKAGDVTPLTQTDAGGILAIWYMNLVKGERPKDVFVTASHCARTMAEYTIKVRPKGVIANDAGFAKDRSGVIGLAQLADAGIAAAAVTAASARIGDPMSTYQTGVISEANAAAQTRGVGPGMSARDAASRMLTAG